MASSKMPIFNDNCLLIVEDICANCLESENLKTCTRCRIAKYCSAQCQKEDFPDHKKACKRIKKLTDKVEELAEELRCARTFGLQNLFVTQVGRFWCIFVTRDYCRARLELANEIEMMGYNHDSKRIYEIALAHYLELLRLIHGDNLGIRDKVPFLLLALNRDEDAYNFIKWWETIDPDGHYDWGEPPASQEGDWLYLKGQDINENLLTNINCLPFLAALALIKARIILTCEIAEKEFQTFQEVLQTGSSINQKLLCNIPALTKIKRFLGCNDALLREQKQQLEVCLNAIQRTNPYFLKAVVNPRPILDMEPPQYTQRGTVSEVYGVIVDCSRLFERNKIVMAAIIKRVGNNPTF